MVDDRFDVVVVGAGLAGGVCARVLSDWGYRVIIVDSCTGPGGLLNPVAVHGHSVDQGPHFFFHDRSRKGVRRFIESLVQTSDVSPYALTCPTGSLRGAEPYPIVDSSCNGNQSVGESEQEVPATDVSLEAFLCKQMSTGLYHKYFQGYNRKFWECKCMYGRTWNG